MEGARHISSSLGVTAAAAAAAAAAVARPAGLQLQVERDEFALQQK
eukprot:CAMPEP_0206554852 /NCGR_PEP_ID=MMETSP0325_2-20121206/17429_1 /ASSEMBLY_ACC=CAM_ASM_000347 /TAXON_ID=2866 /ORGANISM="Crypthecodinium cohnii, Strain Seligo" /LENGTH=45 /DNA_ID= /DNA_START= /DNA_END= /DNA_ORIENTATION=